MSLRYERDGAVAVLTLDNQSKLNVLSKEIRDAFAELAPQLIADADIGAILITGAGRAFCAGGDFSSSSGVRSATTTRDSLSAAHRWIAALITCDKPIVTAVNGPAAGAGFGLAMLGDFVLASRQAFFRAAFRSVGAAPDYALAWTLPRAVGALRAKEILFSDRRIPAEEAERIGMVSRLIEHDELMEAALKLARDLAAAPYSLGLAKQMTRQAFETDVVAFLEKEAVSQAIAFASQDFAEGVAAFKEKRTPNFKRA